MWCSRDKKQKRRQRQQEKPLILSCAHVIVIATAPRSMNRLCSRVIIIIVTTPTFRLAPISLFVPGWPKFADGRGMKIALRGRTEGYKGYCVSPWRIRGCVDRGLPVSRERGC
jgi:hypothetical protein